MGRKKNQIKRKTEILIQRNVEDSKTKKGTTYNTKRVQSSIKYVNGNDT